MTLLKGIMSINSLKYYDNNPYPGIVQFIYYSNTLPSILLASKNDTAKSQRENAYKHQTLVRLHDREIEMILLIGFKYP